MKKRNALIAGLALALLGATGASAASVYHYYGDNGYYDNGYYDNDYYRYHHYYRRHHPYFEVRFGRDNDWYWRHHYWRYHHRYDYDHDYDRDDYNR